MVPVPLNTALKSTISPNLVSEIPIQSQQRYLYNISRFTNLFFATFCSLNNLAFSLENCKFTCAINPECEAIEFSEGYFCKLFSKFNSDDLKREIGTVLLTKPSSCIFHLNKKQRANYPFRDAVKDINSIYNKAQLVGFWYNVSLHCLPNEMVCCPLIVTITFIFIFHFLFRSFRVEYLSSQNS